MTDSISNSDDVIDSRNVIARIEELEGDRQGLVDELDEATECVKFHHNGELDEAGDYPEHIEWHRCREALSEWDAGDDAEELRKLKAFAGEAAGYAADWRHGAMLVHDSHFQKYAEEEAEAMGLINTNASWPYTCIGWEKAATELQQDYTSVDFDGETYWTR